jgi:PPM family protein phosphatase
MAETKTLSYTVSAYGLSDKGLVRQNNEDYWGSVPESNLFLLADGMGGHQAGEVAARETVTFLCSELRTLAEESDKQTLERVGLTLKKAIQQVNRFIYEMSLSHDLLKGMGTTLCLLYIHGSRALFSHIGDSRIYRLRQSTLQQLTQDHSLAREMRDLGDEFGDQKSPIFKNIITKAVGTEQNIDSSIHVQLIESKDTYLLCSDGLSDCLSKQEIEDQLNQPLAVEERVRALIHAAKEKGGHDNITVVLVEVL